MWEGRVKTRPSRKLRAQLATLEVNYGSAGASSSGVTIDEMNQAFTGIAIDALVHEISANLDVAVRLCEDTEKARFSK